jgi:hypothetical protein
MMRDVLRYEGPARPRRWPDIISLIRVMPSGRWASGLEARSADLAGGGPTSQQNKVRVRVHSKGVLYVDCGLRRGDAGQKM